MRIARPAPYLNMGKTWMLSRKYKGRAPRQQCRERYSRQISLDFVAAGQDAVALVIPFCVPCRGNANSMAMDLQITAFPQPKCTLFLADAAAIKVCPFVKLSSIRRIQVWFVGGHGLSFQISKACGSLCHIENVWAKHHSFGRRRVEEVQENSRAGILRGEPWSPFVA